MTHYRWQGYAAAVMGLVAIIAGIVTGELVYVAVGVGVIALVAVTRALESRFG